MSSLSEGADEYPEHAMHYRMAPVTVVWGAIALLTSLTIFIWASRGLYRSRKASDTAPDATKDATSKTADAVPNTITTSKRLENLSFAVILCFTISCIMFLPASLHGTLINEGSWGSTPGGIPGAIMSTFWFFGYVMMFFVFVYRLKEIDGLSRVSRNVCIVLLSIIGLGFVGYMVIYYGGWGHIHHLKAIFMIPAILSYLCFAVLIMVLFIRKLFQQMKIDSDPEMLQNPELLELITRYTVLGFVGIGTSMLVQITWAVYFAHFVKYVSFLQVWVVWMNPMDAIINMTCVSLYLPFATEKYERICCLAHSVCKHQCARMLIGSTSNDGGVDKAERTQDV